MVTFELGNPETIEQLARESDHTGKFLFRRDELRFRLFLGEFKSHPIMVKTLQLIKEREELQSQHIWGGGEFVVYDDEKDRTLFFSGSSWTYGRIPSSFLIDCCRKVKIPHINRFKFSLDPYSLSEPEIADIRKTWKDLGNYEIDTSRKEYLFDANMNPIKTR